MQVAHAFFLAGGAAVAADAPTLNGSESFAAHSTAANTHSFDTSGQTITAGDFLLGLGSNDGGLGITSFAGGTDDTYGTAVTNTHSTGGPNIGYAVGTVVSALDAALLMDLAGATNRDACGGLLTITGASGIDVASTGEGASSVSPEFPGLTTTVPNTLLIGAWCASGGHTPATMSAAIPSGWTEIFSGATGTDETQSAQNSLYVAYKVQATADTVAAAVCTSALDGAGTKWVSVTVALEP